MFSVLRLFVRLACRELRYVRQVPTSPRHSAAMVYDADRERAVLFGGWGWDPADKGDTWAWDGAMWNWLTDDGPPPQHRHSMAYDRRRKVIVLLGWSLDAGYNSETWEFDGEEWRFRTSDGPPYRFEPALAYDEVRGVVVLFGGFTGSSYRGDTWEWDGETWTLRSTTGPPARSRHGMTFDSARGVTVLFGGTSSTFLNFSVLDDSWEWDGRQWTSATVVAPPGRASPAMAFDRTIGKTVLFGGVSGWPFHTFGDEWHWNGAEWTQVALGTPTARTGSRMVYDEARRALVLFGGNSSAYDQTWLDDTWEFVHCPVDTDGDGVPDDEDECDESQLSQTVVIGECESGVTNQLFEDGCTMADRIGECESQADSHGAVTSCVTQLTNEWAREGLLTSGDRGAIQRCAARADVPSSKKQTPLGPPLLRGEAVHPVEMHPATRP